MIFDRQLERIRQDGKREDEGDFEYLNASDRHEAAEVRGFLEDCLDAYPVEHRPELVRRFRESDVQFASASFELFLHACFAKLGWAVEIHPEVPGGNGRRPDFRVRTDEVRRVLRRGNASAQPE